MPDYSNQQQSYDLPQYPGQKPAQSKIGMILICFFVGSLGIHRYLMGYRNWWLQLITLGGCGIWSLVDFIRIIVGDMVMADGRPLKD